MKRLRRLACRVLGHQPFTFSMCDREGVQRPIVTSCLRCSTTLWTKGLPGE